MPLTNQWNRVVYRLWSPVYDRLFDRLLFAPARKDIFKLLGLSPGERVLLVGVGTGADLPYLPPGVTGWGIDLSPEMLQKAQAKLIGRDLGVGLTQGDAQVLPFPDHCFDTAVLSLVLSVVPDGHACWLEVRRVLRPGGKVVIFDKFLPEGARPNLLRRLLNLGSSLLGTDINRRLGDILGEGAFHIERDEPSLFNGMYRILLIHTNANMQKVPADSIFEQVHE